jgi:hypothetical protein
MDATVRRRWVGGVALVTALAMLVGGDMVLKEKPGGLVPLIYWLGCLGLTVLAMIVAFADVRALAQRTRREQRELFEATLRKIETEAQNKARRAEPKGE